MQELQPGLRGVFVLRYIEGLSTAQAEEVLELTPVAVEARAPSPCNVLRRISRNSAPVEFLGIRRPIRDIDREIVFF